MPIRLIDPNATRPIEISGTVFHVRALSAIERSRVGFALDAEGLQKSDIEQLAKVVGGAISKIDGIEDLPPSEVILRLEDPNDFWKLIIEIMGISKLSEGEAKNSGSSSDGSTSPTGEPVTTVVG